MDKLTPREAIEEMKTWPDIFAMSVGLEFIEDFLSRVDDSPCRWTEEVKGAWQAKCGFWYYALSPMQNCNCGRRVEVVDG